MAWFSKKPKIAQAEPVDDDLKAVPSRMEGLWVKCDDCGEILYRTDLEKNLNVCPKCTCHMQMPARMRLAAFGTSRGFTSILCFATRPPRHRCW